MDDNFIGGVIATAPLFNKVTPDSLREMVQLLSDASGHFADDSGKEWSMGRALVRRFAATVNASSLPYYAIVCLHRDQPQLVTLDHVMDAVLKDARG